MICFRDIPTVATAQYEVEPRQGCDGGTGPEADGAAGEGVELVGYQLLAVAVAVAAEGAEGGLQPVETFAELEVEVVGVGRGGLVDGLHHAGGSLVGIAVDLVVASVAVVGIDAEEQGV